MSRWQSFGYEGEEGTCKWCGRRLIMQYTHDWQKVETKHGFGSERVNRRPRYEKPGYYGDGHFCSLRCAYQFAVDLADRGHRLRAKK